MKQTIFVESRWRHIKLGQVYTVVNIETRPYMILAISKTGGFYGKVKTFLHDFEEVEIKKTPKK